MSRWFGRKKGEKEKKTEKYVKPSAGGGRPSDEPALVSLHRHQSSSSLEGREENGRPTSSLSSNENASRPRSISPVPTHQLQQPSNIPREPSQSSVKAKRELYESLSKASTPEYSTLSPSRTSFSGRVGSRSGSSSATPIHDSFVKRRASALSTGSQTTPTRSVARETSEYSMMGSFFDMSLGGASFGKEKEFPGVDLRLPPLQTSKVKHRDVIAIKSPALGGFGFNLRKSFQPDPDNPENTLLVHLVEPRPTYIGPLMSGDRILEVNGERVESSPHERVVELIKLSGDQVNFRVASVPELIELNDRGVFDDARTSSIHSTKKGVKAGAGTLRKKAAQRRQSISFQAKSEDKVASDKKMLQQNKHWLVHKDGFSLVVLENRNSPQKGAHLSSHVGLIRSQSCKVTVYDSGELIEVDETDLEKVNSSELDRVEDIVELVHLNESSVLHVLRQRYGSSLIHTFAGRHMIIINPLRHLSLYSDRVIEMFRGCRREDMPPHIFASGQQAYYSMLHTNNDQSLILTGLSGSGKTFNARYLLRYLSSISHLDNSLVTSAKLDAVQLLLHAFTSAGTFLNPQATRCSSLYSLEFDSGGSLLAASARIFLLEKARVASRPEGELNFNIFYQLLAGVASDESLKRELLLNTDPGTDEANHYIEPYSDPQQIESAAIVWDLIQNCLDILDISDDEAYGLWSILAAIYHLGYAGVKQGSGRVTERFLNPSAAIRAATLLGIPHEELAKDIFSPPRGNTSRMSSLLTSSLSTSPSMSETSSVNLSISSFNISPGTARANRSYSLDAFVMGLFDHALSSLVLLINRALQPTVQSSKGKHLIHVLDTPGFQNREMAGCNEGSSFDELCMNYTRERLQMLFHDFVFTAEQDRYLQEDIDWLFSEVVLSPLSVIDVIDKHVPQRRGPAFQGIELNDKKGLLWILEEESTYPGSNEMTFLEKLHSTHGEPDDFGETAIKVNFDKGQFTIVHCQRSQAITYDVTCWKMRVREHPSTRVVGQILPESKNRGIASLYQGRGVAAGGHASSYKMETQQFSRLSRHPSFTNPTAGIKKSSLCLKTKFQLDFLIDTLRKTTQWYIVCILCQPPIHLPGALLPPSMDPDQYSPDSGPPQGHIDVPLVRNQLRQADVIPAARIYKQGYPEHQLFPAFRRRYSALLQPEEKACLPLNDKDAVEFILSGLELDRNSYRLGLSQVFFRAGIISSLDRQVEDRTHDMMIKFQAHLRGYLGRQMREKLELQHAAAHVIQRNIIQHEIINNWSWWKLLQKVKPLLAVWKVEEEVKKKESEIDTLKGKVSTLEEERNVLKDSEQRMAEKISQLTQQLMEAQETAQHATELLEQEQIDRRELQEQNQDVTSAEHELIKRNEELQLQVAELSILARIKQSEGGVEDSTGDSEAVLEKYWETKRELETLRQRISTEHEDQVERLQHSKKVLEKRLADADGEIEDLRRNLAQVRKKATKFSSELNDMKLLLENQQTRNEELEKRQRKFDSDLNVARVNSETERQAKEKFEREKNSLNIEYNDLEEKYKKLKEDYQHLENEKTELETELLKKGTSDADSEIASLKRMKRELESKVEELEDEVDDLNIKVDSLQQTKSRLELAQQSLRVQHQKELEGREEDLEQIKNTMNKKLKSIEQQLEEEHESKQQAMKAKREIEREYTELQAKSTIDPEVEKKLRKQVKKFKALLQDAQEELEHERETRTNANAMRALRSQVEDLELREAAAVKGQKRLQSEVNELQTQYDELTRVKMELENHLSEAQHEKAELESRLEEEQDEVEQLTAKQRQSISLIGQLQQQTKDATFQIEELETVKQTLENKVTKLEAKISELESDSNRQEVEASEVRIHEMEQKLELEKSTVKRQETTIARLRGQLERAQSEKAEESSAKNNDAIKRLQKQLRDLREELQESERREQELNKKRRATETQLSDMEASLQTANSDLKSAYKRIEGLQVALNEGQADEYSSVDEIEGSPKRQRKAIKTKERKETFEEEEASSNDDIHPIKNLKDSGSSEDEEMRRINIRRKQREQEKSTELLLADDDDDEDIDDFLSKLKSKRRTAELDDDMDGTSDREHRRRRGSDSPLPARRTHRSADNLDEQSPPPRRKTDWRAALISSSDEEKSKPSARKYSDSDEKSKRTYDISSDEGVKARRKYSTDSREDKAVTSYSNKRIGRRRYSSSDDGLASKSTERFKPSRSRISDEKDSDSDYRSKKTTPTTAGAKQAWDSSSGDENTATVTTKPHPSLKTSSKFSDSDDDVPLKSTKKESSSPIQSTRKLSAGDDSPLRKGIKWENEEMGVANEEVEAVVSAAAEKSNDKSFQASRQRRARRRSRLSNTGISPEHSPRKSSQS